jgi:hypothetical protein
MRWAVLVVLVAGCAGSSSSLRGLSLLFGADWDAVKLEDHTANGDGHALSAVGAELRIFGALAAVDRGPFSKILVVDGPGGASWRTGTMTLDDRRSGQTFREVACAWTVEDLDLKRIIEVAHTSDSRDGIARINDAVGYCSESLSHTPDRLQSRWCTGRDPHLAHDLIFPLPDVTSELLQVQWHAPLQGLPFAVSNGALLTQFQEGGEWHIDALDVETGQRRWTETLDLVGALSLVGYDDVLVATTEEGAKRRIGDGAWTHLGPGTLHGVGAHATWLINEDVVTRVKHTDNVREQVGEFSQVSTMELRAGHFWRTNLGAPQRWIDGQWQFTAMPHAGWFVATAVHDDGWAVPSSAPPMRLAQDGTVTRSPGHCENAARGHAITDGQHIVWIRADHTWGLVPPP